MKKEKSFTLWVHSQTTQKSTSVARLASSFDACAVAYACHMHRVIEKGLKERWFIIDDSTGTEIPY